MLKKWNKTWSTHDCQTLLTKAQVETVLVIELTCDLVYSIKVKILGSVFPSLPPVHLFAEFFLMLKIFSVKYCILQKCSFTYLTYSLWLWKSLFWGNTGQYLCDLLQVFGTSDSEVQNWVSFLFTSKEVRIQVTEECVSSVRH